MTCKVCAEAERLGWWGSETHHCPDCHVSWTGTAPAHCVVCHRTFTTDSAAQRHRASAKMIRDGLADRVGDCVNPADVGLVPVLKACGPLWGWPPKWDGL